MYISQLELQGFKSFANKTKVTFDDGVTAIVGPNGCGKSNIVDALRWVLGEQRPTQLRSSSMSNVIFNGTAKKNALGMAEVSLTFVNNRGVLPTEYNEVTICRRLYRSGESEYLINNTTCRLKDIMELFMDTGMGSDAYSVIELKMVDEILQDKNNDRRRLFEEAAGVTKYKDKRKKTFRKLEETQADLQRVNDYLVEIHKNVRTLQQQADRAKRAKSCKNELKKLDLALNKHLYDAVIEDIKPLKKRIESTEQEKTELQQRIGKLEEQEESSRKTLTGKEQQLANVQRKVAQLSSSLQKRQTDLKVVKERIVNAESSIKRQQKEIEQAGVDLDELEELWETTQKLKSQTEKDLNSAVANLQSSRESYSELQEEYTELKNCLEKNEEAYRAAEKKVAEIKNFNIKYDSRLESIEDEINRINTDIADKKEEIDRLVISEKEQRSQVSVRQEEVEQTEEQIENTTNREEELREKEHVTRDAIREWEGKIGALESKIDFLEEISKSHDAFPQSVQFLVKKSRPEMGNLAILSEVLSVKEDLAVALESALGPAANFIITDNLDMALKSANLLKEKKQGKATFIPLNCISGADKPLKNSLARQVSCPEKYELLKNILLGKLLLADSINQAYDLVKKHTDCSAVTPEGDVISSDGFLNSGSPRKNAGIRVGLKDKIANLESRITKLEKKRRACENSLIDIQQKLKNSSTDRLKQELKIKNKALQDAQQQLHSLSNKLQILTESIGQSEERKNELEKKISFLKNKKKQLKPEQKQQQELLHALGEEQTDLKEQLNEVEEKKTVAQNRYNDARLKHQELSNKVSNYERDIKRATSGIKQIKKRRKQHSEEIASQNRQISGHKNQIETLESEIASLNLNRKEYAEKKKKLEELCSRQRGVINKIEKELKDLRSQKDTSVELLHKLTMAHNELELKSKSISDHVWEQYELLMEQISTPLPEDMDIEEAKKRVNLLKQKLTRLGETNPLAIEEYEEEKKRLDFYQEQIDDLEEAEEKLRTTIEEINQTAQERFQEIFEKIRANFQKVFKTLFHKDDYCDLVIEEDAEDPLEAKIEIKANPRGKRPSNINQLSGGEKTLTAIALLFSIYLVKPSPFCVLDEVDAPLDDANIERFANMLSEFSDFTQFIIITHNKKTMTKARMMYGVTMPETGVSQLVGVRLEEVEDFELN